MVSHRLQLFHFVSFFLFRHTIDPVDAGSISCFTLFRDLCGEGMAIVWILRFFISRVSYGDTLCTFPFRVSVT